ncbi:MAG: hypothetical protein IPG17_30055, partial [Sandaracinaceae bacterium]|nr:hypothetical protein [Sandaracinaceae bacterium]
GDLSFLLSGVLTDFGNFDAMGERLMQGTINSLVLMKAFAPGGPCATLPELQVEVDDVMQPVLDADPRYYYGISQGGIMGGTLAALSDTIDAYVLQVGAVNYSTLVRRSLDFVQYDVLMSFSYRRKLDRDWLVVSSQPIWSLAEPDAYVSHILRDALPGVDISNRRVLFQISRYDTEVSNAASDMAARDMRLGALDSSVYIPWNVTPITENSVPSAFVIYRLDDVQPLRWQRAARQRQQRACGPALPDTGARPDRAVRAARWHGRGHLPLRKLSAGQRAELITWSPMGFQQTRGDARDRAGAAPAGARPARDGALGGARAGADRRAAVRPR